MFPDFHQLRLTRIMAGTSGVTHYLRKSIHDTRAWFTTLFSAFNPKFILTLVFVQHILKGLVAGGGGSGWIGSSIPFLFKELGNVKASELNTYKAIAMTPWSIKPLMGFCSDLLPIFGYHKRYYIAGSTVVAMVGR